MEKPSEKALTSFAGGIPDDDRVEQKQMFGMPAAFVNGNMFFGVFGNGIVLRTGAARRDELVAAHDGVSAFEPMPGRPWKEYIHADADLWGCTDDAHTWVVEALEFTALMPAKAPKEKKGKK